jgi:hypothetical protein
MMRQRASYPSAGWHIHETSAEGRRSFLKKRTKKLLL